MKKSIIAYIFLIFLFGYSCNSQNDKSVTKEKESPKAIKTIGKLPAKTSTIPSQDSAKYPDIKSIPTPSGYTRVKVEPGSFGDWLRNVKLKTENNTIYLYDGNPKYNQDLHFAILKFDVGKSDLQQCADAVMRLRAEYLYDTKNYRNIHFNFLSDGKPRYFTDYAKGNYSRKKFRNYMNFIFSYANTASLKKELKPVNNPQKNIMPGDVFIQSGKPYGHAVTVVDVAVNKNGDRIFMVSQSYMPAEEINIVKNLNNFEISPWYNFTDTDMLIIPEWEFEYSDLRRF